MDEHAEKEINIIEYLNVIFRRKKLFLLLTILIFSVGTAFFLHQPKLYKSETTILPLGESSRGGLGGLLGMGGGMGALLGAQNASLPSSKLTLFIKSSSFARRVVLKEEVRERLKDYLLVHKLIEDNIPQEKLDKAFANTVKGMIKVEEDASYGAMRISSMSRSAEMSQFILNAALEELSDYVADNNLDDSKRKVDVVGKQLIENRRELLEISRWLTNYYDHNQGGAGNSLIDVPIGLNAESEIANDLNKEKKSTSDDSSNITIKSIPLSVYLKYIQQQSDVLSNINRLLSQEYHMAIVNNIKDMVSFKIIDPPNLQTSPAKPILSIVIPIVAFLALFFSVFLVFCAEFWANFKKPVKGLGN